MVGLCLEALAALALSALMAGALLTARVWQTSSRFFVVAGPVPAIHVFLTAAATRRGCAGQARA